MTLSTLGQNWCLILFDSKVFFDLVDSKKNIIVAFSGGGDSSALLHFCYELNQKQLLHGNLSAIHINHSLNKDSDQWKVHCKKFCEERNIPFQSHGVNINVKKSGLESAARNARYKIFQEILQLNDQLLMAHHADDVAETILFRLFRGTGLDGLQGPMKKRNLGEGKLLRPWLGYSKSDLIEYLLINDIKFISDETNFEVNQDRNFIRNEVLKMASNRWPNANIQIQQTAELVSKQKKVHDFLLHHQFGKNIKMVAMNEDEWEKPSFERNGIDISRAGEDLSEDGNKSNTGLSGKDDDIEFTSHNSFLHDNVD